MKNKHAEETFQVFMGRYHTRRLDKTCRGMDLRTPARSRTAKRDLVFEAHSRAEADQLAYASHYLLLSMSFQHQLRLVHILPHDN